MDESARNAGQGPRVRKRNRGKSNRTTLGYLKFAHLGTLFCLLVTAGVLGGWWLDGKLGTKWVFTLVGTLLGSSYGFIVLYREVFPRDRRRPDDGDGSGSTPG